MGNFVKILSVFILVLFIGQTNCQAQGLKGVFNKTKEAVSKTTKKVTSKSSGTKDSGSESPSNGPAKPLAPEVKNSISELRSYTGLTKEAFVAKMKSQGFVAGQDEMGGDGFKSKSGYFLSPEYGTRGKAMYVRGVTKIIANKSPNLATVKTTFLDLGKQCISLKAKYSGGWVKGNDRKGSNKSFKASDDRVAKFIPAFDAMIGNKEEGGAADQYSEKDYDYNLTYMYAKIIGSTITIVVTDLTIESQFG
jgi:hypothetical protein